MDRIKILIVDDDEHIRFLYSEDLYEAFDCEVKTADGGYKLLEKIEADRIDLVVLDIKMVDYNGLDLLQDIRDRYYDLPVILCTAYDTFKEDMKSIAADYYVIKSFDLSELESKIVMALEAQGKYLVSKRSRSLAVEKVYRRIVTLLNCYGNGYALPKSNSHFCSLLKDLDEQGLLRHCPRKKVLLTFVDQATKHAQEMRQARVKLRPLIAKMTPLKTDELEEIYNHDLWSVLSLARFKEEYVRMEKEAEAKFAWMTSRLQYILDSIKNRDYACVSYDALKAVLEGGSSDTHDAHSVVNIIVTEIRHDFKNSLSQMLRALDSLEMEGSVEIAPEKINFIRELQKREGNTPCFFTDRVSSCRQDKCFWRQDCKKVLGDPAGSWALRELQEIHLKLFSMIDRLSDISFVAGKPNISLVDLESLVRTILDEQDLSELSNPRGETDCSNLSVLTDPMSLGVALRQTIINAKEAVGADGTIRVSVTPCTERKTVEITVQDNGRGIPQDLIAEVLQPKTSYNKEGHSGMGLTLASLAAEVLGGSLKLESEVDLGTKITIEIPWLR